MYKRLFILFLLVQVACVNKSFDFKAFHCALESFAIEKEAKILLLSYENFEGELSKLDWKIDVKPIGEFAAQKGSYQYVAVFKKEVEEFKKLIGDAISTLAYKFENEELVLFQLRNEYYSHFFGRVASSYSENFAFDNNKKGHFTYKDYKLVSAGDSSFYPISNDDEFPFSNEKELGEAAKQNGFLEVRFKLRRKSVEDKRINFVVNLKNDQNLSLLYLREELTLENQMEWKTFHFYYPLQVNKLVASDRMLMYFWNFFRGDFEVGEFQLAYIDNHTGLSRYDGEIISFFNWYPYQSEWQSSDLLNTTDWCVAVPSKATALHHLCSARDAKILSGDFFYSDLSYRTNQNNIDAQYILQILSDDGELKLEEIHPLKNTGNQWVDELLKVKLPLNIADSDRILIYFKNNTDTNFDVRKVICSTLRKQECDK